MIHDRFLQKKTPLARKVWALLGTLGVTLTILEEPGEVWTGVENGEIVSKFNPDTLLGEKADFMVLHELGHVAAATDEEFLLPNLGLPYPDKSDAITDRIRECEFVAVAFQAGVLRELDSKGSAGRVVNVSSVIFKLDYRKLKAASYSDDYGIDALRRELDRKRALIPEPVCV